MTLRRIEEEVILGMNRQNSVIATGGSAVYGNAAMKHLKRTGISVFLDVDLKTLQSRIKDFDTRGLAKRPDQDLSDLFEERYPLYARNADITVDCDGLAQEEVCAAILQKIRVHY